MFNFHHKGFFLCFTFAVVKSTTFLLVKSHLLPTSNLLTFVLAYRSISWSHCFTFVKDSWWQHLKTEANKMIRTYLICDIINDNNSMCTSVVTGRDCPKPFLSCCIPLCCNIMTMITWCLTATMLTICNFMVFPSKSIVRIFYLQKALVQLRLKEVEWPTYKVYSNCTDITFCICIILANSKVDILQHAIWWQGKFRL